MKAIRIIAHQTLMNYCKPASYIVRETYPLPPYSTIIGMIHAICGFDSYHPMQVSVQGGFSSTNSDLYQRYTFGNMKFEKGRHTFSVSSEDGRQVGITRGLGYTETISELNLIIHIVPEIEEDYERILNGLENPKVFPALGRHDDLLNIHSFEVVELARTDEEISLEYNAYVPLRELDRIVDSAIDVCQQVKGTVYKIYKTYKINAKTKRREWESPIRVKHVSANPNLLYEDALYDGEYLVFLA